MRFYLSIFNKGIARLFTLPRFTLPVLITLSLTLAAVLAVVAMFNNMVLKPLPDIKDEKSLYSISLEVQLSEAIKISLFSEKRIAELAKNFQQYGEFSSLERINDSLEINDQKLAVTKFTASDNFHNVVTKNELLLGEQPNEKNIENSVWLSESLWRAAYQENPKVLNMTLLVGEESRQIKGVYKDLISYQKNTNTNKQQMWHFYSLEQMILQAENANFGKVISVFFREKESGLNQEEIIQFFTTYISKSSTLAILNNWIEKTELDVNVIKYREYLLEKQSDMLILLLFTAVVLLIMSSLNLLNLFIAHYQKRRQEFATQVFLGASLGKLKKMVFVENLPTFLFSAFFGLIGAAWVIRLIPVISAGSIKHLELIQLDVFTIMVSMIIVLFINLIFSIMAIRQFEHQKLLTELNSGNKGVNSAKNTLTSKVLFITQISFAVVILTSSAMLANSAYEKLSVELGFTPGNTYMANVTLDLPKEELPEDKEKRSLIIEKRSQYNKEIHRQISDAIQSTMPSANILKSQAEPFNSRIIYTQAESHRTYSISYIRKNIAPDYIDTFKLKLLAGRNMTKDEYDKGDKVAIVNETLANYLSKDGELSSVIGTEFNERQIIGIVADHYSRMQTPEMRFGVAHYDKSDFFEYIKVVMQLPDGEVIDEELLNSTIRSLDLPIKEIEMTNFVDEWQEYTLNERVQFYFIIGLSMLTLLLAGLGSNGMALSFTALKRFEIAIRMAVGASRVSLLQKTLKGLRTLLLISTVISITLTLSIYLVLKEQVVNMPEFSWQAFVLFNIILLGIVCSTIVLVVWKTINKDPMKALREN